MKEFDAKMNRLIERLRRGIDRCDNIEQSARLAEERLFVLDESVHKLVRLIDVSFLILISMDQEKLTWLKSIHDEDIELTSPVIKQFFYRLELYLGRSIIDTHEKRAYIQALCFLQSPLIISSVFFEYE